MDRVGKKNTSYSMKTPTGPVKDGDFRGQKVQSRQDKKAEILKKLKSNPATSKGIKKGKRYHFKQAATFGRYKNVKQENQRLESLHEMYSRCDPASDAKASEVFNAEDKEYFEAHEKVFQMKYSGDPNYMQTTSKLIGSTRKLLGFASSAWKLKGTWRNAASKIASGSYKTMQGTSQAMGFGGDVVAGLFVLPMEIISVYERAVQAFETHNQKKNADDFIENHSQDDDLSAAGEYMKSKHSMWDAGLSVADEIQSAITTGVSVVSSGLSAVSALTGVGVAAIPIFGAVSATASIGSIGATVGFASAKKARKLYKSQQKKQFNEIGPEAPDIRQGPKTKLQRAALKEAKKKVQAEVQSNLKKQNAGGKVSSRKLKEALGQPENLDRINQEAELIFKSSRVNHSKYKKVKRQVEKAIIAEKLQDSYYHGASEKEILSSVSIQDIQDKIESKIHGERIKRDVNYLVDHLYGKILTEQSDYLSGTSDAIDMSSGSSVFVTHFLNEKNGTSAEDHIRITSNCVDEHVAKEYLKAIIQMN